MFSSDIARAVSRDGAARACMRCRAGASSAHSIVTRFRVLGASPQAFVLPTVAPASLEGSTAADPAGPGLSGSESRLWRGHIRGHNLHETRDNSDHLEPRWFKSSRPDFSLVIAVFCRVDRR
jgi:hypothetical protein